MEMWGWGSKRKVCVDTRAGAWWSWAVLLEGSLTLSLPGNMTSWRHCTTTATFIKEIWSSQNASAELSWFFNKKGCLKRKEDEHFIIYLIATPTPKQAIDSAVIIPAKISLCMKSSNLSESWQIKEVLVVKQTISLIQILTEVVLKILKMAEPVRMLNASIEGFWWGGWCCREPGLGSRWGRGQDPSRDQAVGPASPVPGCSPALAQ